MAHPKRKISKTRRDKRRTHYKAEMPQVAVCSKTGESHLYHRAYWHEGKLYYRGKVLLDNAAEVICSYFNSDFNIDNQFFI